MRDIPVMLNGYELTVVEPPAPKMRENDRGVQEVMVDWNGVTVFAVRSDRVTDTWRRCDPPIVASGVEDAGEDLPRVTVIAESLCFGDRNPFTGELYAQSWFADLPGYAAHVVTAVLDITPGCWDGLVQDDQVIEAIGGLDVRYSVTEWLAWAARRWERPARAWECPECRGTCVEPDPDGSLSGRSGTPVLCWCVGGSFAVAPKRWVLSAGPGRGTDTRTVILAGACG